MLTGFTPQELTFIVGKHLSYYRGEHYIRNLFPTLNELKVMLFAAINSVAIKGSDGSLSIPRTALKDAMYATSGFKGITGTITCTPLGDCAGSTTVGVYQAPNFPCCADNAKPLFSETKTLAEVGG